MVDDQVRSALVGPLGALGLVLDDLSIVSAGRRRVVRVAVDRDLRDLAPDDATSRVTPLSLDEVAEATRVVSDVLDGTYDAPAGAGGEGGPDLMGAAPYTLEVSSPGTDRPLHGYRSFRRNVGRLVAFVIEGEGELTARLLAVTPGPDGPQGSSPGTAQVEVPATKKVPTSRREVTLELVTSARVQVEFNRPDAEEAEELDDIDDIDDIETDDGHDTQDDTDEIHEETDDGH